MPTPPHTTLRLRFNVSTAEWTDPSATDLDTPSLLFQVAALLADGSGATVALAAEGSASSVVNLLLPLSLADASGTVRIVVTARSPTGCVSTAARHAEATVAAPSLATLAAQFGPPGGGGGSGSANTTAVVLGALQALESSDTAANALSPSDGAGALLASLELASMVLQVSACAAISCGPGVCVVGADGPQCDCAGTAFIGPACNEPGQAAPSPSTSPRPFPSSGGTRSVSPLASPSPVPSAVSGRPGPLACPGQVAAAGECNGHGTCSRSVPDCTVEDARCIAVCTCTVGFSGRDCSFTTAEADARTRMQESILGRVQAAVSAGGTLSPQVVLAVSSVVTSGAGQLSSRAQVSAQQVVDSAAVGTVPAPVAQALLRMVVHMLVSSAEQAVVAPGRRLSVDGTATWARGAVASIASAVGEGLLPCAPFVSVASVDRSSGRVLLVGRLLVCCPSHVRAFPSYPALLHVCMWHVLSLSRIVSLPLTLSVTHLFPLFLSFFPAPLLPTSSCSSWRLPGPPETT